MLLNILVGFLRYSGKKRGQQKMWQTEMHIQGSFKKSKRQTALFIFSGLESAHDFNFVIICQKQLTGPSQIIGKQCVYF